MRVLGLTLSRRFAAAGLIAAALAGAATVSARAQGFEQGKALYDGFEYRAAAKILEPLAESGNAQASFLVGNIYFFAVGDIEQDLAKAVRFYQAAASAGNRIAMFRLGYLYATGQGVAANVETAAQWYGRAGRAGYREAYVHMGDMYFIQAEATDQERPKRELLKQAALLGSIGAQYRLGVHLVETETLGRDHRRGYAWIEIAARRGHRDAANLLREITNRFNPAEVRRGKAWAQEFLAGKVPEELRTGY
jgi:hypothetical protein